MNDTLNLESISQYNEMMKHQTLHPLVSVLDFSTAPEQQKVSMNFGFYAVFMKAAKSGDITYGRNRYDYQEGTMVFIAPGQIASFEKNGGSFQPSGFGLVFHPDLIRGTSLGRNMKDYSFFSYNAREALHLSEKERGVVRECFDNIKQELQQNIDKHSRRLIVSNIELLLNYCIRFYDRQFITRECVNKDILVRFENLIDDYFHSDKPKQLGVPAVQYCAGQLKLSANYFGDLIKKETGKSAQEYIQLKLIDLAKERICDISKTISEVAYELGFQYPQHFTRMFKKQVGVSPNEYRNRADLN